MDEIFKALRLVPEFDGNPNVLTRFIKLCDQLVQNFITPNNELVNLSLINGILNKVTGPAARLINSNGIPDTWAGIRTALVNNFADQRDETSLYNDLALLSQGSSTPQEYYEKCLNIFSTLMTYISLHENIPTTIEAKRDLYKKLTLQAFLRGLKDPLGSRIRCMRPDTIEKALEYVHDETNIMYMQNRNEHTDRRHINPPKFNSFNTPGPSHQFQSPQPYMWQHRPQMWQPKPQMINQPQNAGPSRTQQMFRAPPPNYNPQSHVFKMSNRDNPIMHNSQFNKPTPMSGVSHFINRPMPLRGHDWTKRGNPPPTNYFKSRQLNNHECYDSNYYDMYGMPYDPYQNYEYYTDSDYTDLCDPYEYQNDQPQELANDSNPQIKNNDVIDSENFQENPKSNRPR